MQDNVVSFTKNTEPYSCSDDELIEKVQDLISRFQDPDLSKETREEIFNKIIQLTDRLTY
ncbi:hypothetical protein [Lentibacillus salicampi]|uniref:Uncharacterized protein n=1 Tax=Lentibacillus salicampi TaxID=175306 RepID=A0A4Y9AAB6_9BACI|nr:hypothetical protein [Lentibacillus salicampi]TFJ91304.1 hypothetical protein E4U82_18435 [Lentibacillus salicampi]